MRERKKVYKNIHTFAQKKFVSAAFNTHGLERHMWVDTRAYRYGLNDCVVFFA